jgi:FMN reductase
MALDAVAAAGAETELVTGDELNLPAYDPDLSSRTPDARRFVDQIRRSDGVIIATPGYHGTISGMVKNTLDYIEDMREDATPYLDGRVVGCIVTAYGAQAVGTTLVALRSVIHALRGWPTPYAAGINTAVERMGSAGQAASPAVRAQIDLVAQQVMQFIEMHRAWQATRK